MRNIKKDDNIHKKTKLNKSKGKKMIGEKYSVMGNFNTEEAY